jgi:hypothetical protein
LITLSTEVVTSSIYLQNFYSGELQQQSVKQYTQKIKKPPPVPRVDKAGIQAHLLAIVATCDLVCTPALKINLFELNNFQPFCFVERPAVRGFITYLNHTLRDNDIPKKSAIANYINGKMIQLEEITLEIIKVLPTCFQCLLSLTTGK